MSRDQNNFSLHSIMAEEVGQRPGPRARFQGLADLKIGSKFSLNLRILLEPIGALKFLLIVSDIKKVLMVW